MNPKHPQTRDIVIKVPLDVPDSEVSFAINLGVMASQTLKAGMALVLFPMTKQENGQTKLAAGQMRVPILNEKDISRIGTVCELITKANVAVLAAR